MNLRVLAVVVVMGLSFVGVASAEQPFRAVISGNANPQPVPGNPCLLSNTEAGTGHALHLGRLRWASEEIVDLCVAPPQGVVTGNLTLTSASGDVIHGTYTTRVNLDFEAGTVSALGTYELTGGTGRFTGIHGSGEIRASGSLAPPFEVTGFLVGTIEGLGKR
jgi:hypothetical protein